MKHKGFTLLELLITFSLVTLLAVAVIIFINPISLINRANDTLRKKDLDDAKKILEQYLTDTGCYPLPTQICAQNTSKGNCNFCANGTSPQFSYFTKNICDPKHGTSDYLYEVSSKSIKGVTSVATCPQWFRIFSVLDSSYDYATDIWKCGEGGCGISPSYGYDYLVTSPGISVTSSTLDWYCYTDDCVNCGTLDNCITTENDCSRKTLYATKNICCTQHDPLSSFCR